MLSFSQRIFQNYISGTQNVYTDTRFGELLGSVERLTLLGQIRGLTGTSPTLTVQIEHSADRARWLNQAASPEFSGAIADGSGFLVDTANNVPGLNYSRLRIALGGTSPACHLEIYAMGRSPAR
jgi:hypothetical protein